MKFRCPYCRQTFGPELEVTCPHCGKFMGVSDALREKTGRFRPPREHISRLEEDRRGLITPTFDFGRKPSMIVFALAVMVLVGGFLMARVNMRFQTARPRTPRMVADKELEALSIALERFRRDCGRYPAAGEGLVALVHDPAVTNWNGPYVTLIKPDPWKKPYQYRVEAGRATVFSAGPDRTAGTADDQSPEVAIVEEDRLTITATIPDNEEHSQNRPP